MSAARGLGEAGMSAVMTADPDFKIAFRIALDNLAREQPTFEGIAEDFKHAMQDQGLQNPNHPNSWGANFNAAVRRGRLGKTGQREQMQDLLSHGRDSDVMRFASLPPGDWEDAS